MRKLLTLLFFKLIAMPVVPMTTKMPSEGYVDLGTIWFGEGPDSGVVMLPYYKPEGVEEILKPDEVALHVIELIVDSKVIEPHRQLGAFYEMADEIGTKTTGRDGKNLEIKMYWSCAMGGHWNSEKDRPRKRSYKYFPPEHFEEPFYYTIEYPAKEILLIYSINYPKSIYPTPSGNEYPMKICVLRDKRYYAKWKIEWNTTPSSD